MMKKIKMGKSIKDVISHDEYVRRVTLNPDLMNDLSEDTAIEMDGHVYPINRQYSPNVVGMWDGGQVMLYSSPQDQINEPDYDTSNIIDFENVGSLKESIEKQAELEKAERSILISPDNIFAPIIKETDNPEMKLLKEAVTRKRIDIDAYKPRFGSDFNNDKRLFEQSSITIFKLKKMCDNFDIKCSLVLEDKKNAPNPIGERLVAYITTDGSEDNK